MSSSGRRGAASRSQQAFTWLLSPDNDEDGRQAGGSRPAGDKRKGKGGRRQPSDVDGGDSKPRNYIPGFKLREEARPATSQSSTPAGALDLQQAFEGIFAAEIVTDVLASCGGDATAATEALLAMAGAAGGSSTASQTAAADDQPGSAAGKAAEHAVAGPSPSSAAAAAASLPEVSQAAAVAAPCFWDTLPNECKWLIFEQLSLKDLARAARSCREFAAYVRNQRASLRTIVVPEGVSHTAVRGLVAAFSGASGVALWRCAPSLRFQHHFEDVLRAVALGEADRSSGVRVSHLSLARCGGATDGVVGEVCDRLAHLRRLDLSRCVEVGDAAASRLAAYRREAAAAAASTDEDGEDGAENGFDWQGQDTAAQPAGGPEPTVASAAAGAAAAAATAAVGQIQLSSSPAPSPPPATHPQQQQQQTAPHPAMESPDSAVRRIATQRHADMLAQSAAAAAAQHGRPLACGLEELCLRETSVSGRGVKQLLQPGAASSKSLKVLDVSRCAGLGAELDLHPRAVLEVLRASDCTSLRTVVIQLPPEAPLRSLHLDGCRQLQEVQLVAPRLLTLNLSHCGQLRSLSLRCKRLRELKAVNCTHLNLVAGELLCPALETLNLFGCRQLDAEGLEAVAPSLTKLVSLDLTGCINLSRVLLPEAAALRTISVSGCSVLRQVLLASPALTHVKAAGCARLLDVRLGTASLAVLDFENCSNLREVQLSESGGGSSLSAAPLRTDGGSGGGSAGAKPQPKALVLKGCTSLSAGVKAQLRVAVQGR
ncbi:hypothetical protein D9Q98_005595 [Chlorella vulgaris]|uniref:F-box domain-containing protein n=1 Tax=Chlorella vulgaris TaxID=3077 RepID=A0A9D4TM44_CHLVU|nr:hypothetical protein D9Q98_005595 [Chlorella vulgaris]